MPSIAHLARILSLLMVLRGALAGPIVVRDMPCAEDVAKDGAKSSSSNNNANRITVVDPTDKKKEVAQGATNTVDSLRSSGDKKLSSAGDNGKAIQSSSSAGKGTQSSSTDNRDPLAVKVNGSASPATADDRTPVDSNNAALSQTGKASKDNKEANESVGLNKGESSFRPLTGDNNKIDAKGDANANRFGTEGSGSKVGTQGNTVGVTVQKPGEQSSEKGAAASGSISGNRTPGNDFPPSTGDASRLLSSTNPPSTSSDHPTADTTIPLDNAAGDSLPGISVLNGNTKVGTIEGSQGTVVGNNDMAGGKQAGKVNGGKKGDDC